jgi:hypothetical protein
VNDGTKEQVAVNTVNAYTFTQEADKFKQTSACQKADGNCFLGQERSADVGIPALKDHNNVTSVL